ncbi:MAG TPA: kelch repeat-containing protein [Planctomycetota bacterium]
MLLLLLLALQEKPTRLPSTDLKQRVIWGTVCEDGPGLAFGGQDQEAPDGNPHTRVKVDGQWKAIEWPGKRPDGAEIRQARQALARARFDFFEGRGEAPAVVKLRQALEAVERELEARDVEPAPRALTAIAWDAKSKLYVLFGGDHFDYLTNDTWVFDPAVPKWTLRRPPSAPPPRANHALTAVDGKITLKGGYTYTSSTDYVGGQYRNLADGEWTYDVEANAWSGAGVAPDTRVYRTGRLHPDHFLVPPAGEPLGALPANEWVSMKPPKLPAMNRDWGTAVYDPDRQLILRWSGGHSAHGGTDVLQYHTNTNRWELTMPVEFPLGQTYSNTEYPEGVNFNRRPWVTGHTYQSYGYDPIGKKMHFLGRKSDGHVWDPDLGDWTARYPKPKELVYGDCFYTLTITSTPSGLVCWTKDGKLFRYESTWMLRNINGTLPGSVVDNSTLAYDAKRDRLLFWRKGYGDKNPYDGEIQAVDKDGVVSALNPEGKAAAVAVPYLCQIRYDVANDLFLVGGTVEGRTPAYDPEKNRWVTLKIGGEDPSGKKGRNVSLGMMYDAKRKLFWAVDTNSHVYVLRLDPATADLRPL